MKVINEIQIYEVDSCDVSDCDVSPNTIVQVVSHWAHRDRIVLKFQDKTITVLQRDLMLAIQNATNVRL